MRVGGKPTVLVVDDEECVAAFVRVVLERRGYGVLTASGGRQAFDICKNPEVSLDLVITDIEMPSMNGAELAACIADLRPHLPVVFMTGFMNESGALADLISRSPQSVPDVLRKPFDAAGLVQRVKCAIAARPKTS
jgi:CheY-like chemotaxis protein